MRCIWLSSIGCRRQPIQALGHVPLDPIAIHVTHADSVHAGAVTLFPTRQVPPKRRAKVDRTSISRCKHHRQIHLSESEALSRRDLVESTGLARVLRYALSEFMQLTKIGCGLELSETSVVTIWALTGNPLHIR
jgi:hypothetical protein